MIRCLWSKRSSRRVTSVAAWRSEARAIIIAYHGLLFALDVVAMAGDGAYECLSETSARDRSLSI